MGLYHITNEWIAIAVKSKGAELVSLQDIALGIEYMWDAKPEIWPRTSPILFPIVGGLKQNHYRYDGKIYEMGKHGFARDMEFVLKSQTEDSLFFVLEANEETLAKYPFLFQLEIGYQLVGKEVKVIWKVVNQDRKVMYFSIGGHPGFRCPIEEDSRQTDYSIVFDRNDSIEISPISQNGLTLPDKIRMNLNQGVLKITENLFDKDALVIENHQVHQVSLQNKQKKVYVTVKFDTPLVGIWSLPGGNAPFICIEPWYGRCDAENFTGELQDREWGNELSPNEVFLESYSIII